jgi:hypothetical protein
VSQPPVSGPNLGYVIVGGLDPQAVVSFDYLVLAPDSSAVSSGGGSVSFSYGDVGASIRQAIISEVRSMVGDPGLEVMIIPVGRLA